MDKPTSTFRPFPDLAAFLASKLTDAELSELTLALDNDAGNDLLFNLNELNQVRNPGDYGDADEELSWMSAPEAQGGHAYHTKGFDAIRGRMEMAPDFSHVSLVEVPKESVPSKRNARAYMLLVVDVRPHPEGLTGWRRMYAGIFGERHPTMRQGNCRTFQIIDASGPSFGWCEDELMKLLENPHYSWLKTIWRDS